MDIRTEKRCSHMLFIVVILICTGMIVGAVCGCMPSPDWYVYEDEEESALLAPEEREPVTTITGIKTQPRTLSAAETAAEQGGVWAADRSRSRGFTYLVQADGSCAITGMGRNADARLVLPSYTDEGRLISTVTEHAFYGCGSTRSVFIPATLTEIGDKAFAGCLHLSWFAVEPGNPSFTAVDGVLFSRDMSVLICYPAGREADSYTIPDTVRRIEPMAFFACGALTAIRFAGSPDDWANVDVGESNDFLTDGQGPVFGVRDE